MSDSVREAFKGWAQLGSEPYDITEIGRGVFHSGNTQNAWYGYQAATAAADAEWRGVVEKLVGAGKRYLTGPTEQSLIMQGWDSARRTLIDNPTSSLGRDIFESVVDEAEGDLREALAQAEQLMGRNNASNR